MVVRAQLLVVSYDIKYAELEICFLQQQVLVLRVNIYKHLTQFLHLLHGNRGVIDKSTTLACSSQFSADDAFSFLYVQLVLVKPFVEAVS